MPRLPFLFLCLFLGHHSLSFRILEYYHAILQKENCSKCKKKLISNGFFKNKCLVVVGFLLILLYTNFKPAPGPLLSFSFLFKT